MITVDENKLREVLDALTGVLDAKDGEPAQLWSVSGGVYEAVDCMNSIRALRSMLEQKPSDLRFLAAQEANAKSDRKTMAQKGCGNCFPQDCEYPECLSKGTPS